MLFDHVGVTTTDLASGRALLEGSIGVRAWTADWSFESRSLAFLLDGEKSATNDVSWSPLLRWLLWRELPA